MSSALTVKQRKFAEIYLQTGNKTRAAREAGYGGKNHRQTAQDILVGVGVRDYVQRRRAIMMERYCVETSEIIGALVEVATSSIGDVLEIDGSFDIDKCRDRCVDHLIKKIKVTEKTDRLGVRTVTTEIEMYSRLEALGQLVGIFGLKQSDKLNEQDQTGLLRQAVAQLYEKMQQLVSDSGFAGPEANALLGIGMHKALSGVPEAQVIFTELASLDSTEASGG